VQANVERSSPVEQPSVHQYSRPSAGHDVSLRKQSYHLRRRQREPATHNPSCLVHVHRTGIDPARPRVAGNVELRPQLVCGPEVIVVAERDPGAARGRNATITCRADTVRSVVPQYSNTVVIQGCQDRVHLSERGTVVDHEDLEIDVVLKRDRAERVAKEVRPVMRWNDDAHRDHGATLASLSQ
jgi:hypothetical protein